MVYEYKGRYLVTKDFVESYDEIMNKTCSFDEKESVLFMKSVDLPRELIQASRLELTRVILPERATIVVFSNSLRFVKSTLSFVDGQIVVSDEDNLYFVSAGTARDMSTLEQWAKIIPLKDKLKFINVVDVNRLVNNGLIINDDNVDYCLHLMRSANWSMLLAMLNSCDFEQSEPYLVFLIYFSLDINRQDSIFFKRLEGPLHNFLRHYYRPYLSEEQLKELMLVPALKTRILFLIQEKVKAKINANNIPFADKIQIYIDI